MKSIIIAIPLVLLAACQTPVSGQNQLIDPFQAKDQCGSSSRQNLVGIHESAFDKSTLPETTRIIHPNMPVTRDYRPFRLNIYVDKDGKIERVDCG